MGESDIGQLNSSGEKVFVFVGPAAPYRGGIAHFIETAAIGLMRRNHHVHLITFTRQYPDLLFPGKSQLSDGPPPAVSSIRRLVDTLNPFSWIKTARIINKLAPDAVVFKYWMPFFAPAFGVVSRLLRRKGVRSFVIVDNAIPHEPRPGDRFLSRFFLSSCKGAVVMSDSVQADMNTLGVQIPIKRVDHPLYTLFGESTDGKAARVRLGLKENGPMFLFFGFIRKYKGLDILLDAWPTVLQQIPEAQLVIAGEFYEDEGAIRKQVEHEDNRGSVRLFADYIPDDKVGLFFSAADVVVQPYRTATQSGVAQIAYQFEKPVITTDVGGLAETVPHGIAGLVVPPEDPLLLAGAMIRYVIEGMSEKLTAGVKDQKVRFGWEPLYETLEGFAA